MSAIPEIMLPNAEAREIVIQVFEHLADWPIRSTERFRNAILGTGMLAVNPMLKIQADEHAHYLKRVIKSTIAEGRMIDFGFIPNDVIKAESIRARHMFENGELFHPFESWVAVSSWEGGFNGYHISPHPFHEKETLVIELYGVSIPNAVDVIVIYDIVSVEATPGNTRVSPYEMLEELPEEELRNRGSNSLDPLVTFLRLLADASIPITQVEEPVRLNRARAKVGKWPIPGHALVHTRDYVANFHASMAATRVSKGGTHASPIAHWRRAHQRHLASGRTVPVKASKVNWREAEELHRMFYKVT